MFDYRRNNKDNGSGNVFDNMKNIASISIVGTAAFKYMQKTSNYINTVEQATRDLIARERAKIEDLDPLITNAEKAKIAENDVSYERLIKSRTPIDEHPDNLKVPFDFLSEENIDDYSVDLDPKLHETDNTYFKHILDKTTMSAEELSIEMATQSNTVTHLELKYPGLMSALQHEQLGVTIAGITEKNTYNTSVFEIMLQYEDKPNNTTIRKIINIPNYNKGLIQEGKRTWIHRPGSLLTKDGVIISRFDKAFLDKLIPKLQRLADDTSKNPVDNIKKITKYIDNTLSTLFNTEAVNLSSNSIKGSMGYMFTDSERIEDRSRASFDVRSSERARNLNANYHGKKVFLARHSYNSVHPDIVDSGEYIDISNASETAFMKTGTMQTAAQIGGTITSDVFKQGNSRQNVRRGWGTTKSREQWSTKFGIIGSSTIDGVVGKEVEEYIGKASNVGFYFSPERDIFDGASIYVDQVVDGRPQALDYTGRTSESYDVKLTINADKTKAFGPTHNLYSEHKYSKKKVWVNKGDLIGLNPADNSPIYATEGGEISSMWEDSTGERIKIIIDTNRDMMVGDKFIQSKEIIERRIDNRDLGQILLGTEGQNIAEYLATRNGRMGIEFLVNGSSLKRYMNGSAGIGFVNKVLADVMEIKKEGYKKLANNPEAQKEYKKKMKKFTYDFVRTHLGQEAAAGIQNIHIDDEMRIGLELKPGLTSGSDIFHKALNLETLIKDGNKNNNWNPFINRMNEIEKYIRSHKDGVINYNVITYAETIKNSTNVNPNHVSAFIMGGSDSRPEGLVFANLRLLQTIHSTSDINLAKTASFKWNNKGFIGGTKITAEMKRNFHSMGMKGMIDYTDFLQDYRLNYILDKTKTKDMFVLSSKKYTNGSTLEIGGRKIDVNYSEFLTGNPDDIIGKLQNEIFMGDQLRAFRDVLVARDNLHNVLGATNSEAMDKLLAGGLLDGEDLRSLGKAGIAGQSITTITKKLGDDLIKATTNENPKGNKGSGLYLRLPFELEFNGQKGDLLSLINFGKSDMFALSARYKNPDGTAVGSETLQQFYTLSGMHKEYVQYFQEIADITDQYNKLDKADDKRTDLVTLASNKTAELHRKLEAATELKDAQYTHAVHEGNAPLSVQGQVKGAKSLQLGELGMTTDRMTALFTGDEVKSYNTLNKSIRARQALQKFKLKGYDLLKDVYQSMDLESGGITGWENKLGSLSDTQMLSHKEYILKKFNKSLESITRKLPNSDTIAGQLQEISDIMSKGIDQLGAETDSTKIDSITYNIRKNTNAKIDDILEDTHLGHIRNSNALAMIREIRSGKSDVYVTATRFPVIGQSATAFWKLKVYNPEGSPSSYARRMLANAKKNGAHESEFEGIYKRAITEAQRFNDFLYTNQATIASIKGDNDGDFISGAVISFDKLSEIQAKNMALLGIAPEKRLTIANDALSILLKQDFTTKGAMDKNAVEGYIERLTVIKPAGEVLLMPTNAQSSIVVDVINNAKYLQKQGGYESVELRKGIEGVVRKSLVFKQGNEKEIQNTIDALYQTATNKYRSLTKHQLNDKEELRFITDLNYVNNREHVEAGTKHKDHNVLIEPVTGKMTDHELELHERTSFNNKASFNKFNRSVSEQYTDRFGEMKSFTPTAYTLGNSINRLAENISDEADKHFMNQFAENIAQTTLSTKHGTPSYLHAIRDAILQLEQSKGGDAALIDRLADRNLELNMPGMKKSMAKYGFIQTANDSIDFDSFEKYLEEKGRFAGALTKGHNSAIEEKIKQIKEGVKDEEELQRKYKDHIESAMTNYSTNGIHAQVNGKSLMEDWMYSSDSVDQFTLLTADESTNLKKARNTIPGTKEELRRFGTVLKSNYSRAGSLLKDPYENVRTKFKTSTGSNMVWQIENMEKTMDYARRIKNVHGTQGSLINVLATWFNHDATAIFNDPVENSAVIDKIQRSETNNIRRKILQRQNGKTATIFYTGSVIDQVTGGKHHPAIPTPEGFNLARSGGSAKLKAIGVGFLAGAFIGQAINMLTGGDAVPGLGNGSQGLGGEYYEHNGRFNKDIMGREMEMFLREKPVKLASEWTHWNSDLKFQVGMNNMRDSDIQRDNPRYTSSYKGVMVR